MSCCCCPHSRSAGRCFSFFARSYRRRFERRGFEASQQHLLAGLAQVGIGAKTMLEIGAGVGHLHQTLLERGAAMAVGVDLAPAMIEQARHWARDRGLADRVDYICGDFMALGEQIQPAQVTILDKVVCCYPDAEGLVHRSLDVTTEVYALSYPRDRWFTRGGVAVAAVVFRMLGSAFRPYLHHPATLERWITEAGFTKCFEASTAIWLTQVYRRSPAPLAQATPAGV
jgi:magnesium-protoporphyrin O-methyltransferase